MLHDNPQEKKRLLQKKLKRELEKAGYGLKKLQDGSFIVIYGDTEEVIVKFKDIEDAGRTFGLWGHDLPETAYKDAEATVRATGKWPMPPSKDPLTGLDTPETAAIREKI